MQAIICHDAFSFVLPYLSPRELLLMSMTNRDNNRGIKNDDFWYDMLNRFFVHPQAPSQYSRQWERLELCPHHTTLLQPKKAHLMCGLLTFKGCQHCGNMRIRK
eukprot:2288365-Rhodomonas_salina.1